METNVVHKNDWLLAIEGKVPSEEVRKEREKLVKRFARKVKIQGFRPGKAPLAMVEARYDEEIRTELVEDFASEAYSQALKEKDIKPLTQARLTHWNYIQDDELRFEVEAEVLPSFDVKGYNQLKLEPVTAPAREELIERRLESLRQRAARLEPVERQAVNGDFLRCDYTVSKAGMKDEKHTNVLILLGDKENFPEINSALEGKKSQETVEVEIELNEGENKKSKARFHFTIHEVKERKLPDADDNFAKDMGFENMQAFRAKLDEDAGVEAETIVKEKREDQIFKQLIESNPFEPPPTLVNEQTRYLAKRLRLDETPEVLKELEPKAQEHVRLDLIMEAIADKENVEVSDKELEKWYEDRAKGFNIPLTQAKQLWKKQRARDEARRRKTIDFLLERAAQGGRIVYPDSN